MSFEMQDLREGKLNVTRQQLVREYIKTRQDVFHEFPSDVVRDQYLWMVYAIGVFMFGELFIEDFNEATEAHKDSIRPMRIPS